MMYYIRFGLRACVYVVLQVLLFDALDLFDTIRPTIFLTFLLLIPLEFSLIGQYVLVFVLGFLLDLFSLPMGAHAFSGLLVMGIRPYWMRMITSRVFMEDKETFVIQKQNVRWLLNYFIALAFVYELIYYTLANFSFTFHTLLQAIGSTIYSTLFCMIFIILFHKND